MMILIPGDETMMTGALCLCPTMYDDDVDDDDTTMMMMIVDHAVWEMYADDGRPGPQYDDDDSVRGEQQAGARLVLTMVSDSMYECR